MARQVGKNQERTTSQKLQGAVFQGEWAAASHGAKERRKAWFEKYTLHYDKVVTDSLRACHLHPDRWEPGENGEESSQIRLRTGVGALREHGSESSFKVRGSESCFNAHENSGDKERWTIQARERIINGVKTLSKWKLSPRLRLCCNRKIQGAAKCTDIEASPI